MQGQLTVGASWRPVESVNIGVIARSPSLNLYDNTKFTYNFLQYDNGTVDSDYASNQDLDYRFKKPAEAGIGFAIEQPTFGIEADAIYRMKVGAYDQYNGDLTINNINIDSLGNLTTSASSIDPGIFEEKSVLNCRVGGHVVLSDTMKLHLGAFTDKSSLKNSDSYQKVDLYGVTTGVSYSDKNSSIGAGLSYSWSGDMQTEVYDSAVGDYIAKDAKIQAVGLILSGKYYF